MVTQYGHYCCQRREPLDTVRCKQRMVCVLSLHASHAPLIRTNLLWHVCTIYQPRPDLRPSGNGKHLYSGYSFTATGWNRGTCLIPMLQAAGLHCVTGLRILPVLVGPTSRFAAILPERIILCELSIINNIKSQGVHRNWHHCLPDHSPARRIFCKAMHYPFWPFTRQTLAFPSTHMCIFVPLLISVKCGDFRFTLFIAGQRNGFANLLRNVAAINKRPRREQQPYKSLQPTESRIQPHNTLLITAFGGYSLFRSSKLTFSTNPFLSLPTTSIYRPSRHSKPPTSYFHDEVQIRRSRGRCCNWRVRTATV